MAIRLADALSEMLEDWLDGLDPAWQDIFKDTELGFNAINPALELFHHEPIFPAKKGQVHLGAPEGAHIFRAFDGVGPESVRCILIGQDPYPCMAFSTGRAFEIGSYRSWRDLEMMFSHSMRSFTQCVCAERIGDPGLAQSTANWRNAIDAIESKEIALESPQNLVQRWVDQGVLLVNASLTISRFEVAGDPHQLQGHMPLWRPFMVRLLQYFLQERSAPVVVALFGDVASAAYREALPPMTRSTLAEASVVETEHPAAGDKFLNKGNPLTQCNSVLVSRGEIPIDW